MARSRSRKDKQHELAYSIPAARNESEITEVHPLNDNQREALHYLKNKTLTILTGPPGTAKTLLSVFAACEKLQRREIDKIYYVKPIVDTPGEKGIGFLPGTANEKLEPHMAPIRDSLNVFMAKGKADYLIDKKIIEFLPIEHLRGRSLNRCFVVADEMQNATTHSVLTILTRMGEDSSVALIGDVVQRDLANRFGKDGLSDAASRLYNLHAHVGHVNFCFEDVVRSDFVKAVIKSYSDLYQ